jgi:hypothetical protein
MMIRKVADFTATSQVDVGSLNSPRGITKVSPWYHLPKKIDVNPHRRHELSNHISVKNHHITAQEITTCHHFFQVGCL